MSATPAMSAPARLLLLSCLGLTFASCVRTAPVDDGDVTADSADVAADAALPADDTAPDVGMAPCTPTGTPDRIWLGFNDLPENMLGLQPVLHGGSKRGFHWAVPPAEWTIEVHVEHAAPWCPDGHPALLWGPLEGDGPAPLAAGTPAGQWHDLGEDGHVWRAVIQTPLPGGLGMFGLRAGIGGLASDTVQLQVAERTPAIDPFDKIDNWAITFSRDQGKLSVTFKAGKFKVETLKPGKADGTPDFDEALTALGFQGGDATFNAAVRKWLLAAIQRWMRTFYLLNPDTGAINADSVRIQLLFEGDDGLPAADKRAQLGWSQIAVGGEDPGWKPGDNTFFGRAQVDWHNKVANDDTEPDLGVFTTALVRMVLTNSTGAALMDAYVPSAGGAPFGSVQGDAAFIQPGFDAEALPPGTQRSRGLQFHFVAELLTLGIASITAHEIGHSLGMVRSGLPPKGMLADVAGPWAVQKVPGGHIDTPGFNLMQTGSSFSFGDLLSGPPRFAASNLGYLRRRLLML